MCQYSRVQKYPRGKNVNKPKLNTTWVCSGIGLWNFGNEFAKDIVILGVDNSSSCHTNNRKNNLLALGERLVVLMEALVRQRKSLVLTLVKQRQNFL